MAIFGIKKVLLKGGPEKCMFYENVDIFGQPVNDLKNIYFVSLSWHGDARP